MTLTALLLISALVFTGLLIILLFILFSMTPRQPINTRRDLKKIKRQIEFDDE